MKLDRQDVSLDVISWMRSSGNGGGGGEVLPVDVEVGLPWNSVCSNMPPGTSVDGIKLAPLLLRGQVSKLCNL